MKASASRHHPASPVPPLAPSGERESQALRAALSALSTRIATTRLPVVPPTPAAAWDLVLRSGVAECNDNVVGRFADYRTAQLCGQFLLAVDSVCQPEYRRFDLVPVD